MTARIVQDPELEATRLAEAYSMQPCDCTDCDGMWCVWCFEHHGKKACPVVVELRRAMEDEA